MTKKSGIGWLPVAGVTALVVLGGGYFAFRSWLGKTLTPQEGAKVIPQEALLTAFVNTDPKSWSKIKQFGTPEMRQLLEESIEPTLDQQLSSMDKNMLGDAEDSETPDAPATEISYIKDIQPWIGGAMVTLLPTEGTENAEEEPAMLMVIGVKNKLKFAKFARKLQQQDESNLMESEYQGVTIYESPAEDEQAMSMAILGSKILVSPERTILEQAIDTSQGETSLASQKEWQDSLSKQLDLENPLAQVYVHNYANLFTQLIASIPEATSLPESTLKQLEKVESFAAGVGIDKEGIRLQAVSKLDPELIPAIEPVSDTIMANFPEDTIALATGSGISQAWSKFVKQAQEDDNFKQGLAQGREVFQSVGFDLDQDIFSWMDGDYALALIPSRKGILANFGFGGVMILETSDRATSQKTMAKLNNLVQERFATLAIDTKQVEGKEVTAWEVPQQGALVKYSWLDNDSLMIALGGSLLDSVSQTPEKPLANSNSFKTITGSLPQNNLGTFYLNMEQVVALTNNLPQPQASFITPEANAVLNSIRGIGMTVTMPDTATSKAEMIFSLKPYQEN